MQFPQNKRTLENIHNMQYQNAYVAISTGMEFTSLPEFLQPHFLRQSTGSSILIGASRMVAFIALIAGNLQQ